MSKKKILVDLLNLATPEIAGVGVFARNLLAPLLNDPAFPHPVVCYHTSNVSVEKVFGVLGTTKVRFCRVDAIHVVARFLFQQFIMPFRLRQFSLYFNPTLGLPLAARLLSPRTKLIVTIHDLIPFFYFKKYSARRSFLIKVMIRCAAKFSHHVVTVSENSRKDLVDVTRISPSKITIIYNFVHEPFRDNNNEDGRYFLCISTIEPGKNLDNTMLGFAEFLRRGNYGPFKFYWIGRVGWEYTEGKIRNMVRQSGLEGSFVFPGYLSESAKRDFLEKCTAIVYLSFYEGFGLPVLEGFLYNKPAVVSDNSSLPEVTGKAGVTCDPMSPLDIARAMAEVVTSGHRLKTFIPAQLSRFDSQTQIEKFRRLVGSLV